VNFIFKHWQRVSLLSHFYLSFTKSLQVGSEKREVESRGQKVDGGGKGSNRAAPPSQSLTCPGIAVLPSPPVRLPRPATFPLAASRPVIHRAALLLATHTLSPCPRPRPASLSLVQQFLASRSAVQIMDCAFPNVTTIWHGLNLR
jgi:hypothetical protein